MEESSVSVMGSPPFLNIANSYEFQMIIPFRNCTGGEALGDGGTRKMEVGTRRPYPIPFLALLDRFSVDFQQRLITYNRYPYYSGSPFKAADCRFNISSVMDIPSYPPNMPSQGNANHLLVRLYPFPNML